jgi:hypothetical protein
MLDEYEHQNNNLDCTLFHLYSLEIAAKFSVQSPDTTADKSLKHDLERVTSGVG